MTMDIDVNEIKRHSECLEMYCRALDELAKRTMKVAFNNDFWNTSKIWEESLPKLEAARNQLINFHPNPYFAGEFEKISAVGNDIVESVQMMVKSIDFSNRTVDDILFNAGQGKMLLAYDRHKDALRSLVDKILDLKNDINR